MYYYTASYMFFRKAFRLYFLRRDSYIYLIIQHNFAKKRSIRGNDKLKVPAHLALTHSFLKYFSTEKYLNHAHVWLWVGSTTQNRTLIEKKNKINSIQFGYQAISYRYFENFSIVFLHAGS